MRNFTKRIVLILFLLAAGTCFFSFAASKTKIEEPACGQRECCRKKAELPTCDNKSSGTEFGVFDAGNRLFTVRL